MGWQFLISEVPLWRPSGPDVDPPRCIECRGGSTVVVLFPIRDQHTCLSIFARFPRLHSLAAPVQTPPHLLLRGKHRFWRESYRFWTDGKAGTLVIVATLVSTPPGLSRVKGTAPFVIEKMICCLSGTNSSTLKRKRTQLHRISETELYCDRARIFSLNFQDRERDLFDASDATDDRRDERSAGITPSTPPAAAPSAPLASDEPASGRPPPGVSRS